MLFQPSLKQHSTYYHSFFISNHKKMKVQTGCTYMYVHPVWTFMAYRFPTLNVEALKLVPCIFDSNRIVQENGR